MEVQPKLFGNSSVGSDELSKTLMPYIYLKLGEGGMKNNKKTATDKASTGKFRPSSPPKLKVM